MIPNVRSLPVWIFAAAMIAPTASFAGATKYELRITNDTSVDLKFWLHDGQSKNAKFMYNGNEVDEHIIKAGASETVSIKSDGDKCNVTCNGCNATVGKVYGSYKKDGEWVRNNYYEATLEFFQYCGVSGNKNITTYTTNWTFDHGGGKGDNKYKHKQKDSHNSYTANDPANGLTVDGDKVSGHATIRYYEK